MVALYAYIASETVKTRFLTATVSRTDLASDKPVRVRLVDEIKDVPVVCNPPNREGVLNTLASSLYPVLVAPTIPEDDPLWGKITEPARAP